MAPVESGCFPDLAGLTSSQQLQKISERAHEMVDRLYKTLRESILPALAERGIRLLPVDDSLDPAARASLSRHFRDDVLPALTPLAIDASRPFPMLATLSLNLAVLLAPVEGETAPRLAVVQVPIRLPRLVRLPGLEGTNYVLIEEVLRAEITALFPGQTILETAAFRVSRDAELDLDDEGGRDYVVAIEEELKKRRKSRVVRLEADARVGEALLTLLKERLEVAAEDVYRVW